MMRAPPFSLSPMADTVDFAAVWRSQAVRTGCWDTAEMWYVGVVVLKWAGCLTALPCSACRQQPRPLQTRRLSNTSAPCSKCVPTLQLVWPPWTVVAVAIVGTAQVPPVVAPTLELTTCSHRYAGRSVWPCCSHADAACAGSAARIGACFGRTAGCRGCGRSPTHGDHVRKAHPENGG